MVWRHLPAIQVVAWAGQRSEPALHAFAHATTDTETVSPMLFVALCRSTRIDSTPAPTPAPTPLPTPQPVGNAPIGELTTTAIPAELLCSDGETLRQECVFGTQCMDEVCWLRLVAPRDRRVPLALPQCARDRRLQMRFGRLRKLRAGVSRQPGQSRKRRS